MKCVIFALILGAASVTLARPPPPDNVQPRPRVSRSDGPPRLSRLGADDYAFFEAFPAGGAGATTACSTTAPTGARGEQLVFTRASSATCTKTAAGGLATTGIANGDLVTLSSNVARMMFDSTGKLKLLGEDTRTNVVPRSEEFENASWLKLANVVVAPVVTANTAVSPDGATTADTVAYPQVVGAGAQSSVAYQFSATAAPWTCSVYVRSPVSGGGRIYVSATVSGAAFPMSAVCDHVSTSWTRCTATATLTAALYYLQIGIDLRDAAQATQAAQSVYLFGAGCEAGVGGSSYIPTAAAAVTRAAESASFTLASVPGATGSASGVYAPEFTGSSLGNYGGPQVQFGASAARALQGFNNSLQAFDGTNNPVVLMSYVYNTPKRAYSTWSTANGWLIRNVTDAIQTTSAFTVGTWAPTATLCLTDCGGFHLNGLVGELCYDPSEARCR